jgi:ribosomal protein S18 acetylase RimI-like enzyme
MPGGNAMAYKLVPAKNHKYVIDLYDKIFSESLTEAEFEQQTSKYRTHLYLLQRSGEPPAGFSIYRGRNNEVELLKAGVLPEKRRQRAGSSLIDQGTEEMVHQGYSRLKVRISNHWNIMLSMLVKRGFKIIRTSKI